MSNSHETFDLLLKEFECISSKFPKKISIFDIAGYPHYENVCSNILAFYLDPKNEHGLDKLLYTSLMKCLGKSEYSLCNLKVIREWSTLKGGRIDLVIETANQVIGIENKIFHHLDNDLEDYSNSINSLSKEKKEKPVKIILSIKKEKESNGFIWVSYETFWEYINEELASKQNNNSKWFFYLKDFMASVENLYGGNMEIDDRDKFFIDNYDKIDFFLKERSEFMSKLQLQIDKLKGEVEKPDKCCQQYIWRDYCLVHDFEFTKDKHIIATDLNISPKGWSLELFARNERSEDFFKILTSSPPIYKLIKSNSEGNKEGRHTIGTFKLDENIKTIKEKLEDFFDLLIQTGSGISPKT